MAFAYRPAPKKRPTKYEWLHDRLGKLGIDRLTLDQFWSEMRRYGFTQDDIDRFMEEYYVREEDRAERGSASRDARDALRSR
jgi:hypothetical protein